MLLCLRGAVPGMLPLTMQGTYGLGVLYRIWLPLGAGAVSPQPQPLLLFAAALVPIEIYAHACFRPVFLRLEERLLLCLRPMSLLAKSVI